MIEELRSWTYNSRLILPKNVIHTFRRGPARIRSPSKRMNQKHPRYPINTILRPHRTDSKRAIARYFPMAPQPALRISFPFRLSLLPLWPVCTSTQSWQSGLSDSACIMINLDLTQELASLLMSASCFGGEKLCYLEVGLSARTHSLNISLLC
jgi:hypothetical protein